MFEDNKFLIRRATLADVDSIARIHLSSWREAYRGLVPDSYLDDNLSFDSIRERWINADSGILTRHDPRAVILVAEVDQEIGGFVSAGPARDPNKSGYAEIFAIYAAPAWCGKGMGATLFNAAATQIRLFGHTKLYIRVFSENARARAFYERMGGKNFTGSDEIVTLGGRDITVTRYEWNAL